MIDLDVLVVGGGAQGLWLLNDLTKRHYRAILLERRELGSGQTCHSHGLIHRGHYYDDVDMMIILNAAAQFWEAFVDEKGVSKLNPSRALAGFGAGTAVQRHTYFWSTAGLRFERCENPPSALQGGKVKHLFETDEFSLDASEIIEALVHDVDHAVYKLDDHGGDLEFVSEGASIRHVIAHLSGEEVTLRPKFVVFAAGVGNYGLLAKLGADKNVMRGETPVQAQRKNHMMVLRGPELPSITAVFPIRGGLDGVFLCPRRDPDSGEPVWLVSDHNSTPFPMSPSERSAVDPHPSEEWVQRMLVSLRSTAPELLTDRSAQGLEVAVYTGLTSERNFGVGSHMTDLYIDPLGFENLLAIWPTKLTMTPFASNVALRFIRPKVPEPAGEWPTVEREIKLPGPQTACEMWRRAKVNGPHECKTDWTPYPEFMNRWHVNLG
ncbi:FAD-dependent oxidoreductase [Streptomyces sp. NPDC102270]|uniref:FAD-dependent oxidoreductase n=1 Tax=Streptomyces sp. NPDC102270 TaxID=3366150 RepID=UPI003826F1F1